MSKDTRRVGVLVAVPALAAGAVVGLASPASAAWSDCGSGWNCFWTSRDAGGGRQQYAENNSSITTGSRQSGANYNATLRACAYSGTNWSGAQTYSRPSGDEENFSARSFRSNKFVNSSTCPAAA